MNSGQDVFPWLQCYLGFTLLEKIWTLYLDWRQYCHLKRRELHPSLKGLVSDADFNKAVDYSLDKLRFSIIESTFSFLIQFIFFATYVYPYLWECAGRFVFPVGSIPMEYWQSLVFAGLQLPLSLLLSLPFQLYFDFVIEERHGFNKKTLGLFILDQVKSLCLMIVIGAPLMWLMIWVVRWGGRSFYIALWVVTMVVSLVMMTVYPNFIAPLFNKFEPLKDETLKTKIEALASKIHYPLKKIYEVDASKRSAHSNAYLYGFGNNKRIVLFDTLLQTSHEKILAVVGHELGHWKLSHTIKNMVFGFSHLFVMFYLFGLVFYDSDIYQAFGFREVWGRPVVVGLFLFTSVYEPAALVMSTIATCLSRYYEFQADKFSSDLGMNEDLQEGLIEIHKKNLGAFSVDPWFAWFHYSHPHLVERLDYLRSLSKKSH